MYIRRTCAKHPPPCAGLAAAEVHVQGWRQQKRTCRVSGSRSARAAHRTDGLQAGALGRVCAYSRGVARLGQPAGGQDTNTCAGSLTHTCGPHREEVRWTSTTRFQGVGAGSRGYLQSRVAQHSGRDPTRARIRLCGIPVHSMLLLWAKQQNRESIERLLASHTACSREQVCRVWARHAAVALLPVAVLAPRPLGSLLLNARPRHNYLPSPPVLACIHQCLHRTPRCARFETRPLPSWLG